MIAGSIRSAKACASQIITILSSDTQSTNRRHLLDTHLLIVQTTPHKVFIMLHLNVQAYYRHTKQNIQIVIK